MHKNLTIAIPTFNRAESLRLTLESVDLALKRINPNFQVEVLISDNASTDSTADVCLRYQHFEYFQQPVNLGYDGNVAFLYEKASGEYLLLLSDDDVFECEGLLELVSSIEKNPLTDVFFCNWYSATMQSGKRSQINSLITKNSPKFEYGLIKNITPFYFLSSFVLRKVPVNTEILIRGTYAIQMEIALQILNDQ
jgi:glycosyltransferase involved in cell wall biosynthesis